MGKYYCKNGKASKKGNGSKRGKASKKGNGSKRGKASKMGNSSKRIEVRLVRCHG